MEINFFLLAIGLVLVVLSYIDIKFRAIPSVILTTLLFVVAIFRIENLQYGILAGLFAWSVADFIASQNSEFGVADIKIIAMFGLLIPNMPTFMIFIGVFAIFQFAYTVIWNWRFGHDEQRPFIPCLLAIFGVMWIIGGFI